MARGPDELADARALRKAQLLAASERAAEVRKRRKKMRRLMSEGKLDPWELLAGDLPEEIEQFVSDWKVGSVLGAVPGIGPARRVQVLAAFKVSPEVKLGKLSKERREQLSDIARGAVEIVV